MEVKWWVVFSCSCFMEALSLAACALLFWKIRRMPATRRRRLFPQQVSVLALSDSLLAVSGVIYGLSGYGTRGQVSSPLLAVLFWTFDTTLLAELQIVMGFACQMFGSARVSRCLASCVWLPWLLAAPLTASQIALSSSDSFKWMHAEMLAPAVCVPFSLLIFTAILWRAHTCGSAVSRCCWRRASAYVGNFLITFAPCIAWSFLQGDPEQITLPGLLAGMGLHSNGLVNVITYFAQSRYARTELQGVESCSKPSFLVRFEGVTMADLHDAEEYGIDMLDLHDETDPY